MVSPTAESWTLISLLAAFVDLCLAYFLLCGSLLWWFYSNLFNVFGLSLPCPCTGFLRYVNSSICVHRVFVEMPIRKIYSVQGLIRSKYPFSSIGYEGHEEASSFSLKFSRGRNPADGFLKLNGEVIPVKGKALVNQKQRPVRRRRRVSFGSGKSSPVSPLKGLGPSVVHDDSSAVHDYNGVRSEISETPMRIEYGIPDEQNFPADADVDDTKWHGFEQSDSFGGIKSRSIGTDFDEHLISTAHDNQELVDNDVNKIWILKKKLDEVNAAHSALCLELDKERAAAASAADEAIAMIIRLQEEKASIEMEVRQNQRMVEEKFAYDEEEMNILKEILIRKEKENLFLENEVEAYKQMMSSGDKNLEELWQDDTDIHPDDNLQHIEDGGLLYKNEMRKGLFLSSNCELAGEDTVAESHSCDGIGKAVLKSEEIGDTEGFETQQVIYDVHVVEDHTTEQKLKRNEKGVSMQKISPFDELINFDCRASTSSEFQTAGKMQRRNSVPDFGKSSLSDISWERSRLDSEVGCLREMLQILQEEKEKLKLSSNKDRGKIKIKLLEEIRDQLQEIQYLREPSRHASLPPSFPKKNSKEGCSQSEGLWENP